MLYIEKIYGSLNYEKPNTHIDKDQITIDIANNPEKKYKSIFELYSQCVYNRILSSKNIYENNENIYLEKIYGKILIDRDCNPVQNDSEQAIDISNSLIGYSTIY